MLAAVTLAPFSLSWEQETPMQNIRTGRKSPGHLICTLLGLTDCKRSDLHKITHISMGLAGRGGSVA